MFDFGMLLLLAAGGFEMLLHADRPAGVAAPAEAWISLTAGLLVIHVASDFYRPATPDRRSDDAWNRALVATVMALAVACSVYALMPAGAEHREGIAWLALVGVAGVVGMQIRAARAIDPTQSGRRVLIYGSEALAQTVGRSLRGVWPPARIVGYLAAPAETNSTVAPADLLHGSLRECASALRVDEIVVALGDRRGGNMRLAELLECRVQGIRVSDASTYFEKTLGQVRLDHLHASWLIFGDGFLQGGLRTAAKRAFDVVCAAALLALTLPLLLATALAIALEGGGPVLYRQERVGLDGRPFRVIKFRSMRIDAEADGQPKWAAVGDDRVTRVGAVIRRFRIDEFPQLINVLNGDMSLVGPRPERSYFVDRLIRDIPYYGLRHSVKPGITGWAQVRYSYGATVEDSLEKLQYDLYYVKNHTLALDVGILLRTIGVVVSGQGAR